ncbi:MULTISPECIES: type II toxin-antitoxin system VapC family toxin [unclassified Spirosoma]|uniref:type II toxin-antitoxin system VapC family toxin n=1 Tax=unclassified Spirosoma TaxID=2621999 RepID=UPI00095D2397|nr:MULTISPECIES: type II toxin-antitoxin system VapC family toxin [unclassified Spirosoma]MBN8822602.1 type II toxin-antitoxin system VapC family toxin [Spirosoma sp.]OJW74095.1 MAG: twitching motility protein PilT [Spirosoma sp. 48-14]
MRLLLDTHTLLWFYSGDESLPDSLRRIISNPDNLCFISIASLWEITIKMGIGKLEIDSPITELFSFLDRNRFWVMPIELEHLVQLQGLPYHHKDPFDRLIIAQALSENISIATRDSVFSTYGLRIIW